MIRTIRIRGFKRFDESEFRLPGHVVLAGPNNTGKTTVLQANRGVVARPPAVAGAQ